MKAWMLKMEPWNVCRTMVADSHHFEEELDPDPDPRESRKLDQDPDIDSHL